MQLPIDSKTASFVWEEVVKVANNNRNLKFGSKRIHILYAGISILSFISVMLMFVQYSKDSSFLSSQKIISKKVRISKLDPRETMVIFPSYGEMGSSPEELTDYYRTNLNEDKNREFTPIKFSESVSAFTKDWDNNKFHKFKINWLDNKEKINGDLQQCKSLTQEGVMDISENTLVKADHKVAVRKLIDLLQYDESFADLRPLFGDNLKVQLDENLLDAHWLRFAGTSVWLKDYGVHLMVSRMVYTPTGKKNKPLVSLIYAQVFNDKWEELNDVELVVPTHDPITRDRSYKNIMFPTFIPIPFYSSSKYQDRKYYGPEDARLFLMKNDYGVEEPAIVFNAYHRKISKEVNKTDKKSSVEYAFYRSMFLALPFQYQRGKANVDGFSNAEDNQNIYTRVLELRRDNYKRESVQKNWTPFISIRDREIYGYDKYIYFIYKWDSLEILRCAFRDLHNDVAKCVFVYREDKIMEAKSDIGPLRGGTQMLNLEQIEPELKDLLPENSEVWIGFPRAHIKNCGCGKDMYRPNLAIMGRIGDDFFITRISSFLSLDMEVYGWSDPEVLCHPKEPNALIPNGISKWEAEKFSVGKKQIIEDYCVLSVSVADASTNLIKIRNLLSNTLKLFDISKLKVPSGSTDIIKCAVEESKNFCANYGQEQKVLGKTHPDGVPETQSKAAI